MAPGFMSPKMGYLGVMHVNTGGCVVVSGYLGIVWSSVWCRLLLQ